MVVVVTSLGSSSTSLLLEEKAKSRSVRLLVWMCEDAVCQQVSFCVRLSAGVI